MTLVKMQDALLQAINRARAAGDEPPLDYEDLTEGQVRALRSEAGQAGDADMVAICLRWEGGSDE
jgi:hypothetical protein